MGEIKYLSTFTADERHLAQDGSLRIVGVLIDDSENKNHWSISKEEFESIAKKIEGLQIRVAHSRRVADILGGVIRGWVEDNKILYEGEIDEPSIIRKILKGRVKNSSICVEAGEIVCNKCGKSTYPSVICKCEESYNVLKNVIPKEVSLVSEPAYDISTIESIGFVASVNELFNKFNDNKMEEKRKMSSTDTNVTEKKDETTLQKIGTDAIAVLGEEVKKKLDEMWTKMDERFKKLEEKISPITMKEEKKKQPEEDEEEEEEDEAKKKEKKKDEDEDEAVKIKKELSELRTAFEDYKKKTSSVTKVDTTQDDAEGKHIPAPVITADVTEPKELVAKAWAEIKKEAEKRLI